MAEKGIPPIDPPTSYFQGQQYSPQNNQYSYPPPNYQYSNAAFPNSSQDAQPITQSPQANYCFSNMQNTVVLNSPQAGVLQYMAPPPDYTLSAWLACLCCFCPTGLVAIMRAYEANDAAARGDMLAANAAANSARQMVRSSVIVGICCLVFTAVFVGVFFSVVGNGVNGYSYG